MIRARSAAFLAASALAACARTEPPVKLAVIAPMTGELAADGEGMQRAVTLAVEDARADGSLTRSVEVLPLDDRAEPAASADAARTAAADPAVFAVIGPLTSGCAIEAARVLSADPMPMITPSATASELTLQQERPQWPGPRVVFRLPPSDALQGDSDAEYAMRRLNLKRVAVVHDATPYGLGLADAFRRGFESRGGQVLLFLPIERGAGDYSLAAQQLAELRPDGIFFGGVYVEAGRLIKQARAAGFGGAYFSGDGAKSDDFFKYAGSAGDGAYFSVGGVALESLPSAADFVARYRKRWSDAAPRTFDHYAYEAARIALWALKKTGGDRKAAIDAIRAEPHEAMMGTFIFDSKGDSLKSLITTMKADAKTRTFEAAY
jgi:branched-chain amino acid transport system substrate-binding protein